MIFQGLSPLQRNVLIMVLINALTTPLMLSSVNVALPSIAKDLSMNAVQLSWVPMAYLMAGAMFVLIFGRLADMFGRKKIFLIGTTCAMITSIGAALSSSGELLILFRFLQGMSAAMLYATQVAIISSVFPPAKRGAAIGVMISTLYFGLAAGPFFGGILIDKFGWPACFIFQIPLVLVVLYLGMIKIQGDWDDHESVHTFSDLDVKGATVYAFSIAALAIGVSTLPTSSSFIVFLLGISGLWAFIKIEKVVGHPIFDLSLFSNNRIFSLSCLASFLMYTATFANVVLVSLYLQYLKEYSASSAGLIMMTQPLVMALFSPIAGKLSDRIEPRILASFGIGLTVIGLILLATMNSNTSDVTLITALIITGAGFGLFSSPNTNAIMSAVEKPQYGIAAGTNATMRVVGQMASMIMVTLLMSLMIGPVEITPEQYPELGNVIRVSFLIAAFICLPGIYFSLTRGRMR